MAVGEEGDYIPIVTLSPLTRMTPALRWAATEGHFNVLIIQL